MTVLIDRSAWSKASQRSSGSHYDECATQYENIAYRCQKCFIGCVFTAEAQKEAYEVHKKFAWWQPRLCGKCQMELYELQKIDRDCQKKWILHKSTLHLDIQFIWRWLAVLRSIQTFGKRANSSMEVKLCRCLANIQGPRAG